MKRFRNILYGLMVLLLAAVFFYCGVRLVRYFSESAETKRSYEALQALKEQNAASATEATGPRETIPGETLPQETQPGAQLVTVTHPQTGEAVALLPEFRELFLMNPELVGWISIPGTAIDYPVVQSGTDNTDYYLYRDFQGSYSKHGCIYAREACDVFAPSDNITLYGHRMKDGTMFAGLVSYKQAYFWQDNRYILFDTLTEHHTYEILAVFLTTATVGQGFSYHRFVQADSAEEFDAFIARCKALALYDTGVEARFGDKLITLSTCDYEQDNGRLVVVARRKD